MVDTHAEDELFDETGPSSDEKGSPFGPQAFQVDRNLKIAIIAVTVGIVLVAAFIGWSFFGAKKLTTTQSSAARAVANLQAIVAATPDAAGARVQLAEALINNDQLDDAIAELNAALTIEPENADALTLLARISMLRADWTTAESHWIKVIELLGVGEMASKNEALGFAYYGLGTTYIEQKRYEEAVANLKKSLSITRDSSPAHYALSVAYQRLNLPDMQEQELQIVVAFDPRYPEANYDLGMLALAKGDTAQAAEMFRVSADNAPAGVTAPADELAKMGSAAEHLAGAERLKVSDPEKALSEARIAAALDPANASSVKLVAQLAEQLKDKTRALNAWQKYLELVPGDKTATDAIKRLSPDGQ